MLVGDFLLFPKDMPKDGETEVVAADTILISHIPGAINGLPVAYVLHSDQDIDEKVEVYWEIVGAGGMALMHNDPTHIRVISGEAYKRAFVLPKFDALAEGDYKLVMYVNGDRFMDTSVEIRLPRE